MLRFSFLQRSVRASGEGCLGSAHAHTHALPSKVSLVAPSAGKEPEGLQPRTFKARGKQKDVPETYLDQPSLPFHHHIRSPFALRCLWISLLFGGSCLLCLSGLLRLSFAQRLAIGSFTSSLLTSPSCAQIHCVSPIHSGLFNTRASEVPPHETGVPNTCSHTTCTISTALEKWAFLACHPCLKMS